jgi:glycosyltransferase involved in cell wall biosynthesis
MAISRKRPRFWKESDNSWNFGDAIADLIFKELLFDFIPYSPRPWVIGSMIFDGAPLCDADDESPFLPPYADQGLVQSVFWGCGEREPGSLSPDCAKSSVFLGVRGPLTVSDLKLGADVPVGDPALFLPALHTPKADPRFAGKAVCIPHFTDPRSDEELRAQTGCDEVFRPLIAPYAEDVVKIVDALVSARFVLAGAMHGAIVAAAYGVPFGYLDAEKIDCPFKWADFSASVGIPCVFHETLAAAMQHFEADIAPRLRIPSMWPMLCRAPTFVRPEGLLKVLRHELGRDGNADAAAGVESFIAALAANRRHSQHLDRLACRIANEILPELAGRSDEKVVELATLSDSRTDELRKANDELERLRSELDSAREDLMAIEKDFVLQVTQKANEAAAERVDAQVLRLENQRMAAELAALRADIGRKTEDAFEARMDARIEQDRNHRLVKELAAAREEIGRQSTEIVEQMAGLAKLNTELNAEKNALVGACEAERVKAAALSAQIAAHQAEIEALARQNEGLVQEKQALGHAIASLEEGLQRQELAVLDATLERTAAQEELAAEIAGRNQASSQLGAFARRVGAADNRRRFLKKPVLGAHDRQLLSHADTILAFLAQFPDHQLGMSAQGREDRVLGYLFGATSHVADFPLIDRNHYYARNPDVAEAGLDPFIHYLKHGQREGRSPSSLIDYDFYVGSYPEAAHFDQSIIEHYMRFGVAKGYNPCELFDTRYYLEQCPDVKVSGLNPLIHYMRHPGCRPHILFDSQGYRRANPDVVRCGFNPLLHYLAYGREEGRTALPQGLPSRPQTTPAAPQHASVDIVPASSISNPAPEPVAERGKPLVVMMDAFYPRPDQDSGSLDQVNYVRIFQSLGYDVAFAALLDFDGDAAKRRPLEALGAKCVTADEFVNVEEFVFLNSERIKAFFLSRYNFGGSWIERARLFCPEAQVILNTVDLHHIREERHARVTGDEAALRQAEAVRVDEIARVNLADVTIVVSHAEKQILESAAPGADVRVIPLIRDIPARQAPGHASRSGIAFVGGFEHMPNVDAVTTFLETVWPILHKARPDMVFRVIGSKLPAALAQRTDPNVEWVGYVPELEPHLDQVLATVAPLRFGAGAKGKVVSSLLNGVPCVASEIAFEGMGIPEGDGILVARSPDDYAHHIAALADDAALWTEVSGRGFAAVRDAYSLDTGVELVAGIVPRLAGK